MVIHGTGDVCGASDDSTVCDVSDVSGAGDIM